MRIMASFGSRFKSAMTPLILIAIGANLPGRNGATPQATCEQAARAVAQLDYVHKATRSRWYSSAPQPPSSQPRYINGVLRLDAQVIPQLLLADLQRLERAAGRVRGAPNAARVLDLDIIAMGGRIQAAPDPILPHPRAHERAFVLLPLRDVAPGWVHPGLRLTVEELIARLPAQDIRPV